MNTNNQYGMLGNMATQAFRNAATSEKRDEEIEPEIYTEDDILFNEVLIQLMENDPGSYEITKLPHVTLTQEDLVKEAGLRMQLTVHEGLGKTEREKQYQSLLGDKQFQEKVRQKNPFLNCLKTKEKKYN